ncbi:GFA family protein [Leisingera sp. SS27]|uniref:GFA family protein n=1 Tax=Leisingera sp. SS27 TaxID=2979462 RepID=UPI00232E18C7|nr:GFA family protein [Leisingera sp. SS27]MDC0658267.1 GFA family protein [Leisingera sp. SS27]
MPGAKGGCLCGAIRYEIARQPAKVTLCHCRFCQRATGAAYMIQPAFAAADFKLRKGTPKNYSHISAGSGKEIRVRFCGTCGTKLFQAFERFEGAIGLFSGTLDDPGWLEISPVNSKHIFLKSARSETVIPADTPVFMQHAISVDGTPLVPMVLATAQKAGDLQHEPSGSETG